MRKKIMHKALRGRWVVLSALALAGAAHAQQIGESLDLNQLRQQLQEETARLNALQRSLDEQEGKLGADRQQLREQRRRIDALYERMSGKGAAPAAVAPGSGQPENVQSAQAGTAAPKPVGEAPATDERPPAIAQIFQDPGILTPKGKLFLEPSIQYLHATNNRVALVGFTIIPAITIGLIDIRRVSRDTFVGALTARYGLTNRLEVEAKVPYVYASSTTITRPLATASVADSIFDSSGHGIGDVEFAARYQINQGGVDKPFYVGSFRVK
ncbi:MAG TPA: acetate kinase, partial [Burkholderiales bacterium]|nr:acetate kinase [Burkholderiales bacterium]